MEKHMFSNKTYFQSNFFSSSGEEILCPIKYSCTKYAIFADLFTFQNTLAVNGFFYLVINFSIKNK